MVYRTGKKRSCAHLSIPKMVRRVRTNARMGKKTRL